MVWVLFIVVAVLVCAVTAALITGRLVGDPMAEARASTPDPGLSPGFAVADIDEVRFDTALRGYRMDQVDDVLDLLQARIAELEGGAPAASEGKAAPASTDELVLDRSVPAERPAPDEPTAPAERPAPADPDGPR
ncbi:hypothetical protein GCM10027055_17120 [Janibacter alkaliphilus]|uniref:DivIVA domain-containing protein n=1 Tax=Janibacter alkaliphilus TaxID=1069963 RepID=A0A852X4E7_9MICO|nr:DivIVA domain-containing protein [Janibacter alkaliphilus]